MVRWLISIGFLIFSLSSKTWSSPAWVYPHWVNPDWVYLEHRQISLLAIQQLSPEHRKILEEMWAQARIGYEDRLSVSLINPDHGLDPEVLDLASWPAIAGDHSCSPEEMLDIILLSDWILQVDHIATRLRDDLAKAERQDQTIQTQDSNRTCICLDGCMQIFTHHI